MKHKTTGLLALAAILVVSGCNSSSNKPKKDTTSEETTVIHEGDYAALLPFEASSSRIKHAYTTNLNEAMIIGVGMMNLSKEHFSPDDYAYKESQFLSYDALDATGLDRVGLLGRTSEKNPNGMNPAIGTEIDTNNGKKKIGSQDVLLIDIYELDWYDGKDLEGLSLGIVLNDEIGDSVNPDIVSDAKLRAYGEEVGRKVVSYLRKTHPEIGQKTPIYVTLFKESGVNTTLPGTFIEEAYFESKTIGEYSRLNEAWALFPSSAATKLDSTNATYFDRLVKEIKNFFPEDTAVIGTGHFKDKELASLTIDISMHAKTWPEANAMMQKVNSSLSIFSSTSFAIKARLKSDDVLIGAMQREKGSSKVTVIQLME